MKKLFIPYELALIAKEKGFNESCFGGYYLFENKPDLCIYQDENEFSDSKEIIIQAPLYQQMINWFIEKHGIEVGATIYNELGEWRSSVYRIKDTVCLFCWNYEKGYNEAIIKAIEEAFKLI